MYNQCKSENRFNKAGQFFENLDRSSFGKFAKQKWEHGFRRPKYNVPVNISETETHYEVSVYAVGFDKQNIKISVADDVLHVSGTRSIDENHPAFISQEFPVKSFERIIELNENVDRDAIKATQKDGILFITLPKTAAAQSPAQEIKVD